MALTAAHGAIIKIGNGASTEVFTAIAHVTSGPNGGGPVPNIITARTHDAESLHKKQTYVEYQDISFTIAYDSSNAQHALLLTNASAGTLTNFEITATDGGAEVSEFAAFIGMDFSREVDGWNEATVTLTIDGDVTVS